MVQNLQHYVAVMHGERLYSVVLQQKKEKAKRSASVREWVKAYGKTRPPAPLSQTLVDLLNNIVEHGPEFMDSVWDASAAASAATGTEPVVAKSEPRDEAFPAPLGA